MLRFVKPNMLNGMRRNWQMSTMQTLLRKKAMASIVDPTLGTALSPLHGHTYTKSYNAYTADIDAVDEMLRNNKKFISCVNVEDGRWGIVWKHSSVEYFFPLVRSEEPHSLLARLNYFIWERALSPVPELLGPLPICAGGILLPLLQYQIDIGQDGFVANCYALVCEDHRVVDNSGSLVYM